MDVPSSLNISFPCRGDQLDACDSVVDNVYTNENCTGSTLGTHYSPALGMDVPCAVAIRVTGAVAADTPDEVVVTEVYQEGSCTNNLSEGVYILKLTQNILIENNPGNGPPYGPPFDGVVYSGNICGIPTEFHLRRVYTWNHTDIPTVYAWKWNAWVAVGNTTTYGGLYYDINSPPIANGAINITIPPYSSEDDETIEYNKHWVVGVVGSVCDAWHTYPLGDPPWARDRCNIAIQIVSLNVAQYGACCTHGPYCTTGLFAWRNFNDALKGLCCMTVTYSGFDASEVECVHGYAATEENSFTVKYRHIECNVWEAKSIGCLWPFPRYVSLAGPEGIDPNYYFGIYGADGVLAQDSPGFAERSVMYQGAIEPPAWSQCIQGGWTQQAEWKPTDADIATVTLAFTGGTPIQAGAPDFTGATAAISFSQDSWDDCIEDVANCDLSNVVGWKLDYLDLRGRPETVYFTAAGNARWINTLIGLEILNNTTDRPGGCLLSLQCGCARYGFNYGFCVLDGLSSATSCNLVEIVTNPVTRFYWLLCGYMPGSNLTLTPLTTMPDPVPWSQCSVDKWTLTWNEHDITLSESSGDWAWEPSGSQSYILTREADGKWGQGNYKLAIELSYAITALDTATKTVTIAGSHVWEFADGTSFTVVGSSGNDRAYTVQSVSEAGGNTLIVVSEDLEDKTVDGNVTKSLEDSFSTDEAIDCCYGGVHTLSLGIGETAEIAPGCASQCDADHWTLVIDGTTYYFSKDPYGDWWTETDGISSLYRITDSGGNSRYAFVINWEENNHTYSMFGRFTDGSDCAQAGTINITDIRWDYPGNPPASATATAS